MLHPAPIALFAFNRPSHLARTVDALAANILARESALTIFCDGPRNEAEKIKTDAVRALAQGERDKTKKACGGRFASVRLVEQEKNQGLAPSIIAGVTAMLEDSERVIVLEDDLLTSPFFLQFMNDGLSVYADNASVACVHGYCFSHTEPNSPEIFFLRGADCWGWATWRRAWVLFEKDATKLLRQIDERQLRYAFDIDDTATYYAMLKDARDGKVSSWAVRWMASAFLADTYCLTPCRSLVFHAGNDSSGTHCGTDTLLDVELSQTPITVQEMPVRQDLIMYEAWKRFHTRINTPRSLWTRIHHLLRRFLVKSGLLEYVKEWKQRGVSSSYAKQGE